MSASSPSKGRFPLGFLPEAEGFSSAFLLLNIIILSFGIYPVMVELDEFDDIRFNMLELRRHSLLNSAEIVDFVFNFVCYDETDRTDKSSFF